MDTKEKSSIGIHFFLNFTDINYLNSYDINYSIENSFCHCIQLHEFMMRNNKTLPIPFLFFTAKDKIIQPFRVES